MTDDPDNRLSLAAIGQTTPAQRWRTEAMRSHSSPRLLHISRGQGRITVAGLTSGYGPNNLIFIPARTMYGFEAGQGVFGSLLAIPPAMAGEWPEMPVHLRLKDVLAQKEIVQILDALERELTGARPGHDRAALYHAGLLAVFFARQSGLDEAAPQEPARSESPPARLVAAYTDLVERDYRTARGVADYAALLGVTPTHLSRSCRITCGRSALALLNDRVIHEARRRLHDSRTPVQEIARALGFSSAAYFTRSFQSHTGMTPTAFRRSGPSKG
ncbi:MAG: helix-turn-helix transcriptional regulator [Rubellimicrobium sp.]|nr:helix-turn-helix transcriptional regulator [Rubellimicrobium sp.]